MIWNCFASKLNVVAEWRAYGGFVRVDSEFGKIQPRWTVGGLLSARDSRELA